VALPRMPLSPCRSYAGVHLLLREIAAARAQPPLAAAQLRGGLRAQPWLSAPMPGALPSWALSKVHSFWTARALPLWPRVSRDSEVRGTDTLVVRWGMWEASCMWAPQLPHQVPRWRLSSLCSHLHESMPLRRRGSRTSLRVRRVCMHGHLRQAAQLRQAQLRAAMPPRRVRHLPPGPCLPW